MFSKRFINVSAEIVKAVKNGEPVVALESTIITHGMPWPKNFEMAMRVESIVKQKVKTVLTLIQPSQIDFKIKPNHFFRKPSLLL